MSKAQHWLAASLVSALAATLVVNVPASADNVPGVTATTIMLGGTHPYSGPASAYSSIGKGAKAYFEYVNDHGGVYGRKIIYKDLDDGYNPPQTVQLTRQLVEQDGIFADFNPLGTPTNTQIRPYLNQEKVPQLFVATGATTWGADASKYPWTIGWQPDYQDESAAYAKYLLQHRPNAKVGVIYQNDDYGKDYLKGLTDALGSKSSMIVKSVSYEVTDPDVRSQIASLKNSGADTVFIFATPKASVQSMVAVAQLSWKPLIFLNNVSASQSVMRAATQAGGPGATNFIISTTYLKDPSDPKFANDAGIKLEKAILAKYLPGSDSADQFYLYGMGAAYTMVDALKKAGKNLTRAGIMKAATELHETDNPFVYPGIVVQTSPSDRFPIRQLVLERYDSGVWLAQGTMISLRR
jgi:branched-chain amino acid transport system substrate-binding protein